MRTIKQAILAAAFILASTSAWSATLTRTSSFEYDAATGLLTKETIEPDNAQLRVDTSYTYDAFGNKTAVTVSSPATGSAAVVARTSSMTFDTQGRFALTATNALGQSESHVFDPKFGTMTSMTGPNGLTTQWQYDSFGRKTLEIAADGNRTKIQYLYCPGVFTGGADWCPGSPTTDPSGRYVLRTTPLASDGVTKNGPTVTAYFDGLGKERQKDTDTTPEGSETNAIVQNFKSYDVFGRLTIQVLPVRNHFTDAPVFRGNVYFDYDVLGRVTRETAADSSYTTTAYSGLTVTVTNSLLQTHSETRNSQGKIVTARDNLGGTTTFVYDPFDNLTQTTDAAGNVSSMQYDIRGRKIGMTDPDMGHWTYSYDALGQLVSQTDAKLQTTTYTYDRLGRVLTRIEPDQTNSWVYDTATKGIGKLSSATASNGYSRSHTYDSLGRPTTTTITVDGGTNTHTISQSYDSNGRVSVLTYPSGFAVKYVYTPLGYLQEVDNNATSAMLWKAEKRDYNLAVTQSRQGNNIVTTRTYDPQTDRLTAVQAGPSNMVQNDGYNYDTIGNLQNRIDGVDGVTEQFTYDGLNRLASAQIVGGPAAKTFTYDAIGNITTKSDVGTYSYPITGSVRPHGVSSVTGVVNASYTYDDNGNLTTGAGRNVAWMSFNMVTTVQRGTNVLAYQYDTEHNRIKQADVTTSTLFFNDPASGLTVEKVQGSGGSLTWNNYIYVGGKIVAVFYEQPFGTSKWRYFHHDNLGSTEVITDETGAVVERQSYDTWGKRRFPTGADDPTESIVSSTDRGFTGHAHLAEVGLIHMNGRIYDPVIARFMSADPNVQDPTHTQSLNRYTYVINNPLAYTDPSGYFHIGRLLGSLIWGPGAAIPAVKRFIAKNEFAQIVLTSVAAFSGNVWAVAAVSSYITWAQGGSAGDVIKSFAIAAATAYAFGKIGDWTEFHDAGIEKLWSLQGAENIAGHAAVGCASAVASGGSCQAGAFAAGAGAIAGPVTHSFGPEVGLVSSVVVGGTASVIGGGSFINGAKTAAFGYLFNQGAGAADNSLRGDDESTKVSRSLTVNEAQAANKEFPDLDVSKISIKYDQLGDNAVTPDNVMHFPRNMSGCTDFITCNHGADAGWFAHEVTHVWQYQHGLNLVAAKLSLGLFDKGPYLPLERFRNTPSTRGLNFEQEADWHMWHYVCEHSGC